MPARSTWRGSIQISGLSISVRVFNAVDRSPDIELHQYHSVCSKRIQFRLVCPQHGPVDSKEIVDGYEYAPEQVVLLSPEESGSILPEDTEVIGIEYFVSKGEYEKICLSGKHFYVVPDSNSTGARYRLSLRSPDDANSLSKGPSIGARHEWCCQPQ